jgi:hypothetical protein
MSMTKVNSDNIWKLTARTGKEYFVKCPSKSGARIFLAEQIGIKDNAPFKADLYLPDQIPEGAEVLQAKFRSAVDPLNYAEGNV